MRIIPGIPKVARRYTGLKKSYKEAMKDWCSIIASDDMSKAEREYLLDEATARCFERIEDGDPYGYEEELDFYWDKRYEFCKKHNFDIDIRNNYTRSNPPPSNPYEMTVLEVFVNKANRGIT